MRNKRNFWTKERSFEIALKYNNKRDFKKDHIAAYELLRKNDWLDDACSHMKRPKNESIKWTYDNCKKEALKYKTLKEFRINVGRAYLISKQNNWLDEICLHMIKQKYVTPTIWTFEKCQKEALKYDNRKEFYRNSLAYGACIRNGWLDDICVHMNKPYDSKFKWNREKCEELALKYNTKKDFKLNEYNAYNSAKYNGWLDEICKHMVRYGDRKHKCIYSYEFSDNHVYVGLTYNIYVRDKSRKYEKNDAVVLHVKKSNLVPVLKQLTDYVPVTESIMLEGEYLQKYINDGWIPLNRTKTGGIGGYNAVWNLNRVKKIANSYGNLESLKMNDKYLYDIIKNNEWINSLFLDEI